MAKAKLPPGVRQRSDSNIYQYEFEITVPGEGRPRRFRGPTGCTNAREAGEFVRNLKAQKLKEIATEPKGGKAADTLYEVAERWYEHVGQHIPWVATGGARVFVKRIIERIGVYKPFVEIDNADVALFVKSLQDNPPERPLPTHYRGKPIKYEHRKKPEERVARKLSGATINRHLALLKMIHNDARVTWRMPVPEIAWKKYWQREAEKRVRTLTREEAQRLYMAADERIKPILLFSINVGGRLMQVCQLRWQDVDLQARTASFVLQKKRTEGGEQIVQLNTEALHVLSTRTRGADDALIFDKTNRRKLFEAAIAKAEIEDFRWHDLRHVFATWGLRAGMSLAAIQQQLGHAQVTTTMRYAHIQPDQVAREIDAMKPLVGSGNIVSMQRPNEEHPRQDPRDDNMTNAIDENTSKSRG